MHCPTLVIAVLLAGTAVPLAAQQSPGSDYSGVWVLNPSKSNLGGEPAPLYDTSKVVRAGSMYQIEQIGDFGPQAGGPQHYKYKWPAGDGEATNDLPQGATMHVTTKQRGDTSMFSAEVMVQGQTVLMQTGRGYLSPGGRTLIREMDLMSMRNESAGSIHMVLVYDKK